MWKESGAPGGNPHKHGKNLNLQRKAPAGFEPGSSPLWTDPATRHKTPEIQARSADRLLNGGSQRKLDAGALVSDLFWYASQFGKHKQAVSEYESFPQLKTSFWCHFCVNLCYEHQTFLSDRFLYTLSNYQGAALHIYIQADIKRLVSLTVIFDGVLQSGCCVLVLPDSIWIKKLRNGALSFSSVEKITPVTLTLRDLWAQFVICSGFQPIISPVRLHL